MQFGAKIRDTAEKITEAAADTKYAVTALGVLATVALGVALVALVLAARRRPA